MNDQDHTQRIGRWTLIGLFALFFAPMLIAMGWYAFAPGYTPPAAANGELIEPARPLEPFRLEQSDGSAFTREALQGRWHLVHFVGERCASACQQRLYETRQVRDALGEDRSRVRRVLVAGAGPQTPGIADILDRHPRLIVLAGDGSGPFASQFPADRDAQTVFLVDPLGNLMMRFPPDLDPSRMLDDLEKLMKLSRIG